MNSEPPLRRKPPLAPGSALSRGERTGDYLAMASAGFPALTTTGTVRLGAMRMSRAWPLLPLAPAIVTAIGLAVALAIGVVGIDHLSRAEDAHAADVASTLADAVAARVLTLPPATRLEALKLAARRTGAELLLVDGSGTITLDASLGMMTPELVRQLAAQRDGVTTTRFGSARFAVRPVDPPPSRHWLLVLVTVPSTPEGAPALNLRARRAHDAARRRRCHRRVRGRA